MKRAFEECGARGLDRDEVCTQPPHAGDVHRGRRGMFVQPLHLKLRAERFALERKGNAFQNTLARVSFALFVAEGSP